MSPDGPQAQTRCPECGVGTLTDVTFDSTTDTNESVQTADSREVATYSCGHRVQGASLATEDDDQLIVERRGTDETVDPPVSGPVSEP